MAVRTAGDMYNWTARKIAADPFVVFERQVKPKRTRIVLQALWNGLRG
jgi:phytoene synthase